MNRIVVQVGDAWVVNSPTDSNILIYGHQKSVGAKTSTATTNSYNFIHPAWHNLMHVTLIKFL